MAPRVESTPPPATVLTGRTAMASDIWYNAGYDGGNLAGFYVGVIDTGVRSSHTVFTSSGGGMLSLHRDCVYGNSNCLNSPPNPDYNDQDDSAHGHGTATANIIMGGISSLSGWGSDYRGTTKVVLDYLNTYIKSGGGLDANAAVRAISRAIAWGDDLIIAEMQSQTSDSGAISLAADDAFDLGVAVVGAVGNTSQVSNPGAPGNAHKALSIGNYSASTGAVGGHVSGNIDGRVNPDVQFPSVVDAASNASDSSKYLSYGGSSAATAFAGSAAAILHHFHSVHGTSEPGIIYSSMLVRGTSSSGGSATNGAGKFKFNNGGTSWNGKTTLGTSATIININVPANRKDLRVAIWWPEAQSDAHNNVDLEVLNPSNTLLGSSSGTGTVWELVALSGNLSAATYKVRLKPTSMPRTSQVVYYSVLAIPQ